jgi:FdhE protein
MPVDGVDGLKRQRPEWSPWLSVVEEALHEATAARWERAVPSTAGLQSVPLLSGATIFVDETEIDRLLRRLIGIASHGGTPAMATLRNMAVREMNLLDLFAASVVQDMKRVAAIATTHHADEQAFQAVVALVSLPFLQACNRQAGPARTRNWTSGYCPVCASWPAFAEVRGIERSRYLRCGRCGAEWYARILHCGYCGNTDHDELTMLVPESAGFAGAVEACRRCKAYLKAFTRLQGCRPHAVMIEDLGSVALDVAALEQGYARPEGTGCALGVTIESSARKAGSLAWNG